MPNGVTFAGVPAVLDYDRAVERFVAQRWPASRWPFAQSRNDKPVTANPFQGHETLSRFRLPYPDVPAPRINEVIIPTGASRYGRGLFLFGREEMEQIAASVFGFSGSLESLPEKWGTSDTAAELRIEYDDTFTWQMRALPPMLIDATGSNQLWLLPLVDFRFRLSQLSADSVLSQGETWEDLIAYLFASASSAAPAVTAESAHGRPDRESFSDPGVSVGAAIDAAFLTLGYRAIATPTSTIYAINATESSGSLALNYELNRWAGGVVPERSIPNEMLFIGRKAIDHFGQCGESHSLSRTIGTGSGNATILSIHSPWFVEYFREHVSEDVVPVVDTDSLVAFTNAANKIAADVAAWGSIQFDISIPGVFDWVLGGFEDYMSVRVGGVDNLDSVSTHVRSLPVDFAPLVHLGQRPNIYVHPNETALFTTLEAENDTNRWINARINKMDGFYSGSDIRNTLIFTSINTCAPPLVANAVVMAHYQCEQGWFANPAMDQLPAWEVTATLKNVLKYSDATGVADLVSIRSNFPHIGPPPLVNEDGEITFFNTWQLDGLCDSKVVLQFIDGKCKAAPCDATCTVNYTTGGGWAYDLGNTCPTGCDCPPLPTDTPSEATTRTLPCIPQDTTSRWEIRQVENRRARWIEFRFLVATPSDITIISFWDGEDPEACLQDIDVDYPLGTPCVDSDVVASYDPKTYRYKAVSSESAMLGPPDTVTMIQAIAFDGCGINYIVQSAKVFCTGEPDLLNTSPDLVAVEVLSGVQLLAPIAECANVCRYEWNGDTWIQTQTCESGSGCTCASRTLDPPGVGDPTVLEFPCDRDDGLTPRPGSLDFSTTTILVCGTSSGSGYSIPLTTCPVV